MQIQLLLIVILFACVHLYAGKLTFVSTVPRSRWLSFASGTSVAYIFIHVFPELAEAQSYLNDKSQDIIIWLDHHIYLLSLLGLVAFYGLERLAQTQRKPDKQTYSNAHFYLHVGSFCFYNALVGYLLIHAEHESQTALWLFGVAIALHFFVNDFGLKQTHQRLYKNKVRWVLAASILIGFTVGVIFPYQRTIAILSYSVLAGAIILNVLKEELPNERESRFFPFVLGVFTYSTLLLAV